MAGLKIGLVKRFRAVDAWEAWLARNHASA
jgi:hypothetical protein